MYRFKFAALYMIILLGSLWPQAHAQRVSKGWGGEMDPLQQQFSIIHYSLDLQILPEIKAIDGSMEITFRPLQPLDTLRLNLVSDYKVLSVEVDSVSLDFRHEGELLDIYGTGLANKVKVKYRGKPPVAVNPPWSGGFTWARDGRGAHWVGLSSQLEGGRIFMPCLDHPSSKPENGLDLYIKVPFPYTVAANGRLLNQAEARGYNYFHWATHYPISNYNVNFTMGRFAQLKDTLTSVDGGRIPMEVYVLQENRAKASQLMEVFKTSMASQEKYFGPYPFAQDKAAVVETPYLGMEHQTINGYGNNFQFTKVGPVEFDGLLHHELGHEWWGNKVSVADWKDFWIHEGICSYGDMLFYLNHGGEEAYQKEIATAMESMENKRPLVSTKPTGSSEAYFSDIYTKGALVMHSLRFLVGDQVFFELLQGFLSDPRFTYGNQVDTEDFTGYFQEHTERDLQPFFDLYLYTTELPEIKISKKRKNRYDIKFSNVDLSLPVEVKTSEGIEVLEISKNNLRIKSNTELEIDPNHWYMFEK
ncbi:aminopeptidase [Echinicola pacifica]|uniref:Aminopeptidase N n=1 Tax=Echinicola pacifica TaxID=346377 RepID=A0A918PVK4_9BACT|nr:M1 family metallopeptidase [Echinicola pacifica]GGZ22081.1 aminopeptidase [Echinicola pacifica]